MATRAVVTICALAQVAMVNATSAKADPVEDFYKGKQINWVLSAGIGGGFATYAQVFAPYLAKHIPGRPNIIAQNMTGAGGIRAMNYLDAIAPKDGTTIGLVHSSVPFAPLFGIKGATFDPRRMNWLGSMNTEEVLCVAWRDAPIKNWQDMLTKEFVVGSTGVGNQMATIPAMLDKLFGTKTKVIAGYKDGTEVYLAMERGEVMGRCSGGQISSINSFRPDWFGEGKINVTILVTPKRSPKFPDVPTVTEFVKDERARQLLKIMFAPQYMGRPLVAPPNVPEPRLAALRKAFHHAMNDPEFKVAATQRQLELSEVDGKTLHEVLDETFAIPKDVVKEAVEAMQLSGAE